MLPAYGTGNAPTTDKLLEKIETATRGGIVILDATQCNEGTVDLGVYETSAVLLDRGVVSGSDITSEAALCKLMVLLGDEDMGYDEVKRQVQLNIAGEQSRSIYTSQYPKKIVTMNESQPRYRIPGVNIAWSWKRDDVEMALLRLRSAEVKTGDINVPLEIKLFMNIGSDKPLDESKPNYVGAFKRQEGGVASTLIFDITQTARALLTPGMKASFTVAIERKEKAKLKRKETDLTMYIKD